MPVHTHMLAAAFLLFFPVTNILIRVLVAQMIIL